MDARRDLRLRHAVLQHHDQHGLADLNILRADPRSHFDRSQRAEGGSATMATGITVRVPLAIRRRRGRNTVVTPAAPGSAAVATRAGPALVKTLARAFRCHCILDQGRYAFITEMAAAERLERGDLGKLLRLTLMTPEAVEAVLDGQDLPRYSLPRLLRPFPAAWIDQKNPYPRRIKSRASNIRTPPPTMSP